MTKGIEESTHEMPSTLLKASLKTGFLDEGFYDNFTSIPNKPVINRVDFGDELSGDDLSDEVSRFMDQCTKDCKILFEPLGCYDNYEYPIHSKSRSILATSDNMDCQDTNPEQSDDTSMMDLDT